MKPRRPSHWLRQCPRMIFAPNSLLHLKESTLMTKTICTAHCIPNWGTNVGHAPVQSVWKRILYFFRDVSVWIDTSPDINPNFSDDVCKSYPNLFPGAALEKPYSYIIQTPPKVWRPCAKNVYVPSDDYGSEFNDELFLFPRFGKSLRWSEPLREVPTRTDIRLWDPNINQDELEKMFMILSTSDPELRAELVAVLQDNWDCFFSKGVWWPILGFEFCIDTGNLPPVSCGQVNYGIHESRITMEHVQTLLNNDWIHPCGGSWLVF